MAKQKKGRDPALDRMIRNSKLPRRDKLKQATEAGNKELKRLQEAAGIKRRKRILERFNEPKNIPKRKRQSI
jgi:hypothetical protein